MRQAGEDSARRSLRTITRRDSTLLRIAAVDGSTSLSLADFLPVDLLRGIGLLALAGIGPLRRAAMREGVQPSVGAPRLMRADAIGSDEPARFKGIDRAASGPS